MARRRPALCGVLLAVAVVAVTTRARAADLGVVASDPRAPFVERLVLELEQLGLTVTRGPTVASSTDTAVLEVGEGGIDLHGARANEGGARPKQRLSAKNDALKVAEEVHALMLPLVARPAPPPPPPPPPPQPAPPIADKAAAPPDGTQLPRSQRTQVDVSAGAGALVGTSSAGLAVTAGAAFFPRVLRARSWSFGAGAFGVFAAIPESVSTAAGSAEVRALMGGAEAIARVDLTTSFTLDAALGASLNHVRFSGQASAPFTSREESTTVFSPAARLRAQYMFASAFGLYVGARAGVVVPPVSVRFAGESVAEWGGPWVCLGAGAALAF